MIDNRLGLTSGDFMFAIIGWLAMLDRALMGSSLRGPDWDEPGLEEEVDVFSDFFDQG